MKVYCKITIDVKYIAEYSKSQSFHESKMFFKSISQCFPRNKFIKYILESNNFCATMNNTFFENIICINYFLYPFYSFIHQYKLLGNLRFRHSAKVKK